MAHWDLSGVGKVRYDNGLTLDLNEPGTRYEWGPAKVGGFYVYENRSIDVYGTDSDDVVDGSTVFKDSMKARMYGGNDEINVLSGFDNFVNGNWGSDTIEVTYKGRNPRGGHLGLFLGGKDNDVLKCFEGTIFRMNGNNGDDLITGYKGAKGEFRGGKDNDVLTVHNGTVFGDLGSDTFLMYTPQDYNAYDNEYANVVDYTPGEDQVKYTSALGSVTHSQDQDGLKLYQDNMLTMFLSGISSIDQVTLTAV